MQQFKEQAPMNKDKAPLPRQPKTNPAVLIARDRSYRAGVALLTLILDDDDSNGIAFRAKCVALSTNPMILHGATQEEVGNAHGYSHTSVQDICEKARKILVTLN